MTTTADPAQPGRPAGPAPIGRIGEIDGLRGLALTLVVLFHVLGAGRVSGGVDVFLTLSGFLVTRSLLRRAEAGRLRLADHYGRTLARLAPPALVVLTTVAVAAWALVPPARLPEILREVAASAAFRENWELIDAQLAYGAAGPQASPLQHFWSLSVQGQFFAAWPLLVLACVVVGERLARRSRTRLTPARLLALVVGAATLASFVYAVHLTSADQPTAYLSTWSRFWELGAGAVAALVLDRLHLATRLSDGVRAGLGWAGLALVAGCGFVVDGARVFPGPWTLVPVGGALLVLAGAGSGSRWASGRTLQLPVLRWLADVSYALYLWHWPVLVLWLLWSGAPQAGAAAGAAILAVSVLLGWATTALVGDPVVRWVRRAAARGVPALAGLAAASLVVVGGTSAWADTQERRTAAELRALWQPSAAHPGAAVLADGWAGPTASDPAAPGVAAPFRPAPHLAAKDRPHLDDCSQTDKDDAALVECVITAPADGEPTARVFLVGASHLQAWEDAYAGVAEQAGWEVTVLVKHSCRLGVTSPDGGAGGAEGAPAGSSASDACAAWGRAALDRVLAERPDAVVVEGTRTYEDGRPETVIPGQVAAWQELDSAGVRVVTMRDNPRFAWRVPDCLDAHGAGGDAAPAGTVADAVAACSRPRAEQLAAVSPATTTPGVPASAVHVDLTDAICGPVTCEVVVGNVLAYRDDDHLSGTYVQTLAPALEAALRAQAPWLFPAE